MATFATTSAANQPPSAGRLMLATFRAENVPTVSAATTAPHKATAAMSESSRLCPARQRATQAHTTMEAAPRSVPRKAANPITPTTMIGSPGSFDDIEPTCTADRMPSATIIRHTSATNAVAQPQRNAVSGRGRTAGAPASPCAREASAP